MWLDNKFLILQKILEKEKGSLLDVGCRDQILKKFLNEDIDYKGMDIVQNKQNTNIIQDFNKELNLSDNSFDTITALDVLEHTEEPLKIIKKLLQISKKQLIINLPNIAYYEKRLNFLMIGDLGSKYHFSGTKNQDRHHWFTNYILIQKFMSLNFSNYKIIPVFKTRNKLKFLFYIEKYLYKIFPNLFCWSLLIIIKK